MRAYTHISSFKPVLSRARSDSNISNSAEAHSDALATQENGTSITTQYGIARCLYRSIKDRWADVIHIHISDIFEKDFTLNKVLKKFNLTKEDRFCIISDFKNEVDYQNTPPSIRYRDGLLWDWCPANIRLIVEVATNLGIQSKIPPWIHLANRQQQQGILNQARIPVTLTFEGAQAYYELLYELLSEDERCMHELGDEWHDIHGCMYYDKSNPYYSESYFIFSHTVIDRLIDLVLDDAFITTKFDRILIDEIEGNLPFLLRSGGVIAYDITP